MMKKQLGHRPSKQPQKGFEIIYDKLSERMVLNILDPDTMLPLLIKIPEAEPRELRRTITGKLHMQ